MQELLLALVGALTGSGTAGVLVAVLQRRWTRADRQDHRFDALVAANKVLLIDKVRHLGKRHIARGTIPLEDKENLLEMYAAYKALGGNGHLEAVMQAIDSLQVV